MEDKAKDKALMLLEDKALPRPKAAYLLGQLDPASMAALLHRSKRASEFLKEMH